MGALGAAGTGVAELGLLTEAIEAADGLINGGLDTSAGATVGWETIEAGDAEEIDSLRAVGVGAAEGERGEIAATGSGRGVGVVGLTAISLAGKEEVAGAIAGRITGEALTAAFDDVAATDGSGVAVLRATEFAVSGADSVAPRLVSSSVFFVTAAGVVPERGIKLDASSIAVFSISGVGREIGGVISSTFSLVAEFGVVAAAGVGLAFSVSGVAEGISWALPAKLLCLDMIWFKRASASSGETTSEEFEASSATGVAVTGFAAAEGGAISGESRGTIISVELPVRALASADKNVGAGDCGVGA